MLSPRLRWKLARTREQLASRLGEWLHPQPKPRVCFSCGRLVGAAESSCSHCGSSQAPLSLSVFKRVALAVIPEETPVSYALLFANLLLFLVTWVISVRAGGEAASLLSRADPNILLLLGAQQGGRIFALHEYWRLVMPIFLHSGIIHFGFNSFVLWQVGPQVEELFGSRRFLFLYLSTGVAGALLSSWWHSPYQLSVGSSGSLMGLMGILISYLSQRRGFATEYRSSLIRWALFILVIGILPGVDNAAHVGGLLSGLVFGRLVSDRRPATPVARLTVGLMLWSSALVLVWSVVMVLLHLPPAPGP